MLLRLGPIDIRMNFDLTQRQLTRFVLVRLLVSFDTLADLLNIAFGNDFPHVGFRDRRLLIGENMAFDDLEESLGSIRGIDKHPCTGRHRNVLTGSDTRQVGHPFPRRNHLRHGACDPFQTGVRGLGNSIRSASLHRSVPRLANGQRQHDEDPHNHHDALHDIGPDHGVKTSVGGVDDDRYAKHQQAEYVFAAER